MKNMPRVSQCCGAKIYLFGQRRRQCAKCRRTWRVRIKKRGRPPGKMRLVLLERIFRQQRTLASLSRRHYLTPQGLSYRFRKVLRRFVRRKHTQRFPKGRLILLLDGTWFSFKNQPWILHIGALKPIKGHYAIFLDPLLFKGADNLKDWMRFIETIPPKVRKRICAVVCDNFRSSKRLAQQNHWMLQLCHFHLIRQFQSRRGHWKPGIGRPKVRELIYQLVRQALELPNGKRLYHVLSRLNDLQYQAPTTRLPMLIREFLRNIDYYRSYRTHRFLHLPGTTNTIESMNRLIRDLMRRCGNLRTPESLQLWITAFIRMRPKMICNGKNYKRFSTK